MHGYAHQVAAPGVPLWMLLARPWSLGAILPALAFVLIEVAGHNVDKLLVTKPTTKETMVLENETVPLANAQRTDAGAIVHTQTVPGKVAARELWHLHPESTLQELVAVGGCSLSTASRWRKAWQENGNNGKRPVAAVAAQEE